MSLQAALQSPVVLFYVAAAFGLLLLAGPLLAVRRNPSDPAWQSYQGWLMIVPATAAAIILGRTATILFFAALGLWGFIEYAQATGLSRDRWLAGGSALGIVAMDMAAFSADPASLLLENHDRFMTLPLFIVAGILVIPIARDRAQGQLHALEQAILGFLLFGWLFGHVALLANATHAYAYLIYLLFAVEVNDVAAFCFGKWLGRHPLRRTISPKKTWEGSLGALAVSLALPWALWFTFPHLGPQDLLVIGLLVGVGGQIGDLVFSVIKRDLGIKDMGTAIPGHGGILDRIDSLIYVAPLYVHYLRYRS